MKLTKRTGVVLALAITAASLASCGNGKGGNGHTYNTFTSVSPSNWNELTYQDSNDTQIMSYLGGSFFEFDYKFDAEGEIIPGKFEVKYGAVKSVSDVTAEYAGKASSSIPAGETEGYAYEFQLRDDIKFDDGTAVKASDFVYTMKQQLDPLFQNYRADSYYNGSTVIHNAKNYVYQGQHAYSSPVVSENYGDDEYIPMSNFGTVTVQGKDAWGTTDENGKTHDYMLKLTNGGNWDPDYGLVTYAKYGYFDTVDENGEPIEDANSISGNKTIDAWTTLLASADENGQVILDAKLCAALQDCIAYMHNFGSVEEYAAEAGDYAYVEWQEMAFQGSDYAAMEFDQVGIKADGLTLTLVLDNPLYIFDKDGELSYKAAYNFASLPLVQESKYEAHKKAPQTGSTLWTTDYNSDVASSASWGPYKLTQFQAGKSYTLEKNKNWYGWNMKENEGKYQTDKIVCETIAEWNTAWLKFQAGEIDSIGIDVSIASEYKNSERSIFTPDDYVGSLQLQSSYEGLKAREKAGVNKTILAQPEFRKAISLGIDRSDYTQKCTTSSKAGFGLFNTMHYYDVANGGVYRDTQPAKEVLCETYGVDKTKFSSLDEAVNSINGYDLDQARTLVDAAYDKAVAAGDIKQGDKVVLTYGTAADNESTRRAFNYINDAMKNLAKGTKLEGNFELEFDASFGTKWADDFRDGAYDICQGGWSGAAWDPGYFLLAYLSPQYMYSAAWDTSAETATYTVKGEEYTMSLMDWYYCLNGAGKYNWAEGAVDSDTRLGIIAMLEGKILTQYYTVPLLNYYSASLLSYKVDYISTDYNTFMGYGGIKYMTYNYTDAEWSAYCKKNTLNYKQ